MPTTGSRSGNVTVVAYGFTGQHARQIRQDEHVIEALNTIADGATTIGVLAGLFERKGQASQVSA